MLAKRFLEVKTFFLSLSLALASHASVAGYAFVEVEEVGFVVTVRLSENVEMNTPAQLALWSEIYPEYFIRVVNGAGALVEILAPLIAAHHWEERVGRDYALSQPFDAVPAFDENDRN